jgi:hypothetical protein
VSLIEFVVEITFIDDVSLQPLPPCILRGHLVGQTMIPRVRSRAGSRDCSTGSSSYVLVPSGSFSF